MKVLRIFATEFFGYREVQHPKDPYLKEGRYSKRRFSTDFSESRDPQNAKDAIHKEYGHPPELMEYKYPPERFVRIHSHAIVDDAPERGEVETWQAQEMDLLSPSDLKKAQQDSPRLQAKRK